MTREEFCEQLMETCGELEQLEITITCLEGLISWCELCFNDKQEEKDCELLKQAHTLLMKVFNRWEETN